MRTLCKFYMHGACLKGDHCDFSHDWQDQANNKGVCSYGSHCRCDHVKVSRARASGLSSYRAILSTNPHPYITSGSQQVSHASVVPSTKQYNLQSSTSIDVLAMKSADIFLVTSAWTTSDSESSTCLNDEPRAHQTSLRDADRPICSFAAAGQCPYGERCSRLHGDLCTICGKHCLHPFRDDEREDHIKTSINCKYFDFGNRTCPFGTSRFYKHAYRDGRLEEVVLRHLDADDGGTVIAKNIRLSDFLCNLTILKLHSILLKKPVPIIEDYQDNRWRCFKFIYVLPGWEGSAHDGRVLRDAMIRFDCLKVPQGCYYLVDSRYCIADEFLAPFRGQWYHLNEFHGHRPHTTEEYFNMKHSKVRNVIERCFGLLKGRWKILASPSFFPIETQVRIILACFLLHNLIRKYMSFNPQELEPLEEYDMEDEHFEYDEYVTSITPTEEWTNFKIHWLKSSLQKKFQMNIEKLPRFSFDLLGAEEEKVSLEISSFLVGNRGKNPWKFRSEVLIEEEEERPSPGDLIMFFLIYAIDQTRNLFDSCSKSIYGATFDGGSPVSDGGASLPQCDLVPLPEGVRRWSITRASRTR
ncbi:hypothetical protein ZIOFF_044517 [Zingiber officinale]|uniref:C3H1-type domain-containing protein n=1 Tax=Zingiber officinale TaxID=94328 RepID=A0A8J5KXC7_ZINOF|nr:hypothetical protein ZIOFF_044517 [Zingiber officinale]